MDTQINVTPLWRRCLFPLLGLSLLAASNVSSAAVVSGSSSSYGEWVNLTATPLLFGSQLTVNSGPMPSSAGTAPAAYNVGNTLLSASVSGAGLNLSTDLLATAADSNIDGTTGVKHAAASAVVDNLSLGVFSSLLGLNTGVIQSSAMITGDVNALNAVGSTTLLGASLRSLLLVPVGLTVNPAANTHVDVLGLLGLAGVDLILNEQILTGNGNTSLGLEVNAIHLAFNNFLAGTNFLNGDIIIGHSEAQVSAIPLPPTAFLLASGLFGLFGFRRRDAR